MSNKGNYGQPHVIGFAERNSNRLHKENFLPTNEIEKDEIRKKANEKITTVLVIKNIIHLE